MELRHDCNVEERKCHYHGKNPLIELDWNCGLLVGDAVAIKVKTFEEDSDDICYIALDWCAGFEIAP